MAYAIPKAVKPKKVGKKQVVMVANGDLRLSANQVCWEAQKEMEAALAKAVADAGYELVRAHPYKKDEKHGFIGSQKEGMEVFAGIDPKAPIIVAEAVWQYSHHVLSGLLSHEGPILTVANWSGQWPGLVGMLNINGSLTKAGKKYSTLWSEDFTDKFFTKNLNKWLTTGKVTHSTKHVTPLKKVKVSGAERRLGEALAEQLRTEKAIMGIFDEGCMGMYNGIIQDEILNPMGVFKERLSQSALYYETTQVSDAEAKAVRKWYDDKGMTFVTGKDPETELTDDQILTQCKMYIAAVRIADDFGCDMIGIQYQQGLKDLLPASDLVEGTLNNTDRPPVKSRDGKRVPIRGPTGGPFQRSRRRCRLGRPDDQPRSHRHGTPPGNHAPRRPLGRLGPLLHHAGIRLGLPDQRFRPAGPPSSTAGRAPPPNASPSMYFRLGGGSLKGISKPGEIVWSRVYIEKGKAKMDIGRAGVIELPLEETQRRWDETTSQWPIMHAVTYGVSRDQFMAKHKANHIQVAYADDAKSADKAVLAKAAMAEAMGMEVNLCGTRKNGKAW